MKKRKHFFLVFITMLATVNISVLKAQDTIVKLNGEVINAKVIEVGTNAITFKRTDYVDGPTFIEDKKSIAFVTYRNGQKQMFGEQVVNTFQKPMLDTAAIKKDRLKYKETTSEENTNFKNRIDFVNNKYTLNGQRVKLKDVDRMLSKSKNPALIVAHKTAKTTKTLQKIIGITSIPSTISGGMASTSTFYTCFVEANRGSVSTSSYLNAGLSFLGTLSLPITSKILKNRRDKLYDKVIDLYNVTN